MARPAPRKASRRPTRPAPPALSARARKAALSRFTRRTTDLFPAYVRAGRSTPALAAAARRLKADVDAWTDRHGRSDLRATARRIRHQDNGDGFTCASCEWLMVSMGRLCFLVGCDPEWNNCSYICITLPKDPDYPVS